MLLHSLSFLFCITKTNTTLSPVIPTPALLSRLHLSSEGIAKKKCLTHAWKF